MALNETGRRAIMADPDWRGGDRTPPRASSRHADLSIARMIAMVTYHSQGEHGPPLRPQPATRPVLYPSFGPTFDVEGYLHYHGDALVRGFDANSYLYLTRAMDLYDVGRDGGESRVAARDRSAGFARRHSFRLALPARADHVRSGDASADLGKDVTYHELDSPHGHDAFLKEWAADDRGHRALHRRSRLPGPPGDESRWLRAAAAAWTQGRDVASASN